MVMCLSINIKIHVFETVFSSILQFDNLSINKKCVNISLLKNEALFPKIMIFKSYSAKNRENRFYSAESQKCLKVGFIGKCLWAQIIRYFEIGTHFLKS